MKRITKGKLPRAKSIGRRETTRKNFYSRSSFSPPPFPPPSEGGWILGKGAKERGL
jgi:hypothetical protein